MVKGVLLDLGGTVYVDNDILPGVRPALDRLRASGIPFLYLTNTSRTSHTALLRKLAALGIPCGADELFTAPMAVQDYLREHALTPLLLVHPAIRDEFAERGQGAANAVVLGDVGASLTYDDLNCAFRLLLDGAPLLAVGDNRYFREADGMSLDAGPFVRALEYAAGCEGLILGKPSPAFYHAAVSRLGCRPAEVLMVGDDVQSDVNGALKAGLKAALVQTGKYRPGDEARILAPGACVCAGLAEALGGVLRPSG